MLIAILIVVVALLLIGGIVLVARARSRSSRSPSAALSPDTSAERPMTGLESALDQATSHDGRPMREALDAETDHVEDLRVPDDTGPLLRRALDHVATPDDDADAARDDGAA